MLFLLMLSVALGYRRGITAILFSFAAFAVSVVITVTLYNTFSEKLIDTKFGQDISKSISEGVCEYVESLQDETINKIPFINAEIAGKSQEKMTKKAVKTVMSLLLLLGAYFASKIIILILRKVLHFATGLPIIHTADALLGSMGGLLLGIIWMSIIYIYSGYLSLMNSTPFINEQFNSSVIIMFISDLILWF